MAVKHAKQSGLPADQGNSAHVEPTDWYADHTIDFIEAPEGSAPSTPSSGNSRLYVKSDGRWYSKGDDGVEHGPFDAAGGSGPLLYVDSLSLGAGGDDFPDASLSGWTTQGSGVSASAVSGELYDDTCIDLTFANNATGIWRTVDLSKTYYLTFHGVNNAGSDPPGTMGGMIGIGLLDGSGNGKGMSVYNDGGSYTWNISGYGYASTGVGMGAGPTLGGYKSTNNPIVYRCSKSGSTITFGISYNGGSSWVTNTVTDATTHTRIGIFRFWIGGGTNPKMRIGRWNEV